MNLNFAKKFRLVPLFGLFFLVSCAGNGQPLTEAGPKSSTGDTQVSKPGSAESYFDDYSPSETSNRKSEYSDASSPAGQAAAGAAQSDGFKFNPPKGGWALISGPEPGESGIPYEYYNASTGRRAVLMEVELPKGEPMRLMDRAQMEMQAFESSGKKATLAETYPGEAFGGTGAFFDVAGKRYDTPYEAVGFVVGGSNRVYTLTLSATDNVPETGKLKEEWQEFFSDFTLFEVAEENGPELSPERVQQYSSQELGYSWSVKDTLWHHWMGISRENEDPDLVLSNKAEDVSLFIYGADVPPEEVSQNDLFKVLLVRLGVDPNNPTLEVHRQKVGERYAQDFTLTHVVNKFDFHYKGRFFYDNGRGILIVSWTQGVNKGKYAKVMDNAIEGLKMGTPTASAEADAKKQAKFNAAVMSQVGLLRLLEDQPLVALSYFERANKMDPEEPLYLINCGFVYQMKELYGPGINHFQSQMELVRKNGKLLSILGEMYEALFDYGHAREYAEAALRYTPNNPEYVINLSDALWGLGQRNQSLMVVQRLYDTQPNSRLGVYLAKTYMGLDQYAEAVDILYGVRGRFGMSVELGTTLMDALMFLGRYEEARAIGEETLNKDRNDYKIWTTQGKILFYSRNYREAEKALTKALSLRADNEDAKSFLSATKAFLGKADNRTLQKPIDPVEPRTADLKTMLNSKAKAEATDGDFPAVIHYRKEMLKADKGASWTRSEEMLMEILDTRGTAIYREFTFDFLPGFDRIYLNALEVYDSNWKLKQKANLNGAYITYATEVGGGNESQTAHFPLQELAPGDFIYLQFSRTNIENKGMIPYTDFISSRDIPIGESVFRIYADTSKFVTEEYGDIKKKNIKGGVEWSVEDPVVIRKELYMPVYQDFGSGVLLTGKQKWSEVGEDYENLIKHQFKQAVAVREKALEVKGRKAGDNAVHALARFVRNDIRYRDIRFGGHSLIPQTAESTLKQHRGDCKDMALLLKEMLEAIGVKSYLTAIHLKEEGYEHLPTIQQFNHMILYVPKQGDISEMWIDATDKTGNDRPIPLDMEGKVALVIDGENSHVVTTPVLEKNQEHQIAIEHRLFISNNGESQFRDSVTLAGKFGSAMRNRFYGRDVKEQEKLMEEFLMAGIPDVSIGNVKIGNLTEFNKPLTLVVTYASKGYFGQGGSELKGRFPNVWERSLFRFPKVNKRHHPIRMPQETLFSYSLKVTAEGGREVDVTGPKSFSREPDYVSYDKGCKDNAAQSCINWTTFALYADASEYEKIRQEWTYLLSETSPMIEVK
ncbi:MULTISPECIES: transglutaminase domain-containing protein [unclassified Fibrobacter]|uniref:transglutaminase domain-containing protein n=1 Tax=unclassified Fibrobacter TaxID=2634177 RepID=UPI000D6BDE89|nr:MULTISPECIES: transglutaminase domain-containing protein [unclassified Fibrobacter]PWJ60792.1 tetratricopeptide (TPR) repeat protein [Fibrobacter sp. UWR4]PZW64653.1 tetratricopeptide (TPR) repeat protein [Fibrobacter sp. UWR1]